MENNVMIFPAPSKTPKESRIMGSGVRYFANDNEKTAVIYMVMAKIAETLNQKKIFFSV